MTTSIRWIIIALGSAGYEPLVFVGDVTGSGLFAYTLFNDARLFATPEAAMAVIARRNAVVAAAANVGSDRARDGFALVPVEVTEPVAPSRRRMI